MGQQPASLTITNARIFDGSSAELTEGDLHIVDGVFVDAATADAAAADAHGDTVTIDARGGTVVPGLIDAHCHAYGVGLDMVGIESSPLSYVALKAAQRLNNALRRGFTTVRDVAGGDPGLARAVDEGLIAAPRYFYTGPALSQTGGHGDPRPGDHDLCVGHSHMSEVVDGVDAVRTAVRERFRRGAHAIKIMTSGGVISLTDPIHRPQYSADEVRAITDEASRRGSYVTAHAYSPAAIEHSVTNGVRSIEHGNLLDEATAKLMAAHDAFLVPTLAAYDALDRRGEALGLNPISQAKNREVLDSGKHAIELARDAGVRVGFGTDLMGDLEDDQLAGLRLQAEVLGVLDALRSATSVNAQLLGRDDLGRIGPGAAGDLILFDGDPFADASLLWTEEARTVVRGGTLI
ncbi:metal-dependent hydrolase family protein [Jiangella anatolica]|uniref:Amidohydrolase family protein n=1 Tax=Jiangella anatolica TaxID=2670374 RepID=A0A2W2CJP0_9ACTN|nr:amidohydrolase family protein [Jiangella anatolica]PZF80453.1 amidohydrolase family protein [Jiangella anatolica]